jgi:hypothetical protein
LLPCPVGRGLVPARCWRNAGRLESASDPTPCGQLDLRQLEPVAHRPVRPGSPPRPPTWQDLRVRFPDGARPHPRPPPRPGRKRIQLPLRRRGDVDAATHLEDWLPGPIAERRCRPRRRADGGLVHALPRRFRLRGPPDSPAAEPAMTRRRAPTRLRSAATTPAARPTGSSASCCGSCCGNGGAGSDALTPSARPGWRLATGTPRARAGRQPAVYQPPVRALLLVSARPGRDEWPSGRADRPRPGRHGILRVGTACQPTETILRGDQVRLGMQPEAARPEVRPGSQPCRRGNRAKRTARRGRTTP